MKTKIEKKFEYVFFARSYLTLACLGVEEIREKIKTGKYKNPTGEITPDWVYEHNYLLAPVFFNIKHSIELFLKSITKFVKKDEEFEKHHDIKKLFRNLKKSIGKKFTHPSEERLEKLGTFIEKYHGDEFLLGKVKDNFAIKDRSNDVFRYPENVALVSFEFFYIFREFNEDDLDDIHNDIRGIDKIFYELGSTFLGKRPKIKDIVKTARRLSNKYQNKKR